MAQYSRLNSLDQILDIAGTNTTYQSSSRTLTDETSGLGEALAGQTGSGGSIASIAAGVVTFTGGTGFTANSVGNFITITGAATGANNGTFLIVEYVSATSIRYANAAGVAPDANNPNIGWTERRAYSLCDDLNCERTDRAAIKGVAYDATIPTYTRPTATGTNVPANLSNIAGKTTDAKLLNTNRIYYSATVAATNTYITITSAGNLKHASNASADLTGVPCFDVAPYVGNYISCYTEITNTADGAELVVQAGLHAGEKIFGVTNEGASTSPNSVEIVFYSCPIGGDKTTSSTAYTWEATQPTTINLAYGYGQRVDQLDVDALRSTPALGIVSDADLRQDINDLQSTMGSDDGDTSLAGHLTNTGNYYPFVNLSVPLAPTVVDALNTLNAQIGVRDYTGTILTDGQTITASLQALSDAIASSHVTRTIERLASAAAANVSHLLPGGISYTLDGAGNGRYLWVFWRGVLRDPGAVATGDDYAETDTTHITPYSQINAGDHVSYFIVS